MTYKEALILLNDIVFESDSESLALMEAKEALEKQIPKKPAHIHRLPDGKAWADCCVCECIIPIGSIHCPNCGQRLDWSDEKK